MTRIESDSLGSVDVPQDSYFGSFTTRALGNFQNSSLRAYPSFLNAFAWIKIAAARVNQELGHLEADKASAIEQAAHEYIEGRFSGYSTLDVYQAGAGTPFNMNVNEILANRANEIMGGNLGKYEHVHPNNHVNMAQSSNDTNPTAIRIAALMDLQKLMQAGTKLINALEEKAAETMDHVKVGRTHLQDAVPVTLGQEFTAYASAVRNALARLDAARTELTKLGIGGTATGSGINTHPDFAEKMCEQLSELSGQDFSPAENFFETTHSMASFQAVSAALASLATELLRISNDLRLISSGPFAGFAEIKLPEVQPGSSIMPGKVNPSIVECISMISVQVMGLNHSISLAAQQGQLELNWYTPLIMWDLLHMIEILTNGMNMFTEKCINGIIPNPERMREQVSNSTVMATALAPTLGYQRVAQSVHEAVEKKVPFESLIPDEYHHLLDTKTMTQPNRQ
jgi:fumarate hydratase class II